MPTSSRGYVSEDPNVPNVDGAHMMTVRTRKWNCMSKICAEHAMYGGERKRWSREVNGRGDKHESVNIRRYVPHWAVKACTSEYPSVVVIIIDKAGATTAFVAWANCTIFFFDSGRHRTVGCNCPVDGKSARRRLRHC